MTLSFPVVVFISFTAAVAVSARGDGWPQFRGGNGGVAQSAAPSTVEVGKPLWKVEMPTGHSSPCVWDGSIFLTAGQKDSKKLETICVDRETGKTRWRKDVTADAIEKLHEINNPAAPTPATDGKTVVSYFGSFGLVAYDFDGKELWRVPLPMAKIARGFGTGTSPVIAKGRVFLALQLENDSALVAFDLKDGKEVWRAPRPLYNQTWATPVYWREGDEDRIGLANAGRFIAYDWKDGKEAWFVNGVANQVCATPVVQDGVVYISSAGVLGDAAGITIPEPFEKMLRYDANKDGLLQFSEVPRDMVLANRGASDGAGNMPVRQGLGFMGKKEGDSMKAEDWEEFRKGMTAFKESDMNKTSVMAVRVGGKGDVTQSHVIWSESKGVPEVPSPLVANGRVYMIKNGGLLTCRDQKTGKVLFEERLGEGANGGYYASPIIAGDRIYLASDTGAFTVLRASDKLEILARENFKERIQATPAIVNSILFVRTENHLWAFK
jgi:outer membrane protein assembly factor BamB